MEMLVRNLAGLHQSDLYNDSDIMEKMELRPPEDIVPRDVMRTVLKDAKRDKNFKPSGSSRTKFKPPAAAGPSADKPNKKNWNKKAGADGAGGK